MAFIEYQEKVKTIYLLLVLDKHCDKAVSVLLDIHLPCVFDKPCVKATSVL
jgi:predicted Zn-dependent peptidase